MSNLNDVSKYSVISKTWKVSKTLRILVKKSNKGQNTCITNILIWPSMTLWSEDSLNF